MAYTLEAAQQQVQQALIQLQQLPDNTYTTAMKQLAEFSLARSF
jgi:octaprenyl-diphosphate synthase